MSDTHKEIEPTLREAAIAYEMAVPVRIPPTDEDLFYSDGKYVSEEDYFTYFYEYGRVSYEWNNGILEAKPVADVVSARMYAWLFQLIQAFLETHPIAGYILLEIGFRMEIPDPDVQGATKVVVRKPDLGIVLNDNPISLNDSDKTYHGVCDLCIESLSYSNQKEIDRDIIDKKYEYGAGGVKEYFILDERNMEMHFYRRNDLGKYVEIKRDAEGIVSSTVLQGLHFRVTDLHRQPLMREVALDPLYRSFFLPEFYAQQIAHAEERRQKEEERRQKEKALQEAEDERHRSARYAEALRNRGIDPDSLL
ncbi:MAG: Uma2 family endonuclease [Chloroflexota bacterium]